MLCMCGPMYRSILNLLCSELCTIGDRYCKIVEGIAKILIKKKIIDRIMLILIPWSNVTICHHGINSEVPCKCMFK